MQRRTSKNRLSRLAGITTVALSGILVLQGYWLLTSYQQEQTRFRSEVENALTAMIVITQFASVYKTADGSAFSPEARDTIGGMLLSLIGSVPANAPVPIKTGMLNPDGTPKTGFFWTTEDTVRVLPPAVDSLAGVTLTIQDFPKVALSEMQKVMERILRKGNISTPVQLALLDSNKQILDATCDLSFFKRIPLKTLPENTILLANSTCIQAAVANADTVLLRRMAWILSLSGVAIILGSVSFAYLLKLFFRQKKESEIRNDFMNNMTHELKTPISSVAIALEMIQDKRYPVSEAAKEGYFSVAESELKRLTMLVDKVLKMAAFERSETVLSVQTFKAGSWLSGVLMPLKPIFETAGAEVIVRISPADLMLRADEVHLTNVVQNLLENALKYNGKPRPEIEVAIFEKGSFSVITVTDNGKGIPVAYLRKVFDKFFRIPTGDRHDVKGYGLGLSYVKAIAELHRGSVTVESIPDRQTCFSVCIPNALHAAVSK